jgi:hypothetical protein
MNIICESLFHCIMSILRVQIIVWFLYNRYSMLYERDCVCMTISAYYPSEITLNIGQHCHSTGCKPGRGDG